ILATTKSAAQTTEPKLAQPDIAEVAPALRLRMLWLLLALCGSLLLCAMTNHLTQNVAPIPLLWVIPLIMYLLSFVLAFSHPRVYFRPVMLPLLLAALAVIAYFIYDPEIGEGRYSFFYHLTDAVYAVPILSVCLLI